MSIRILILLASSVFAIRSAVTAQEVRLCYGHEAGLNQTDTLKLYLKSTSSDSMAIRGVNLSFAFRDTCAQYVTLFGPFSTVWGTFFEDTVVLHNLNLTYSGQPYNARLQYGNSDPSLGTPKVIYAPPSTDSALWVMSVVFEGACASQVYPEHESENPVNQLGDINHNRIDYLLESCSPMPTSLEPGVALPSLEVWPNPARDHLFVQTGIRRQPARLRLFAPDGRMVQQFQLPPSRENIPSRIALPPLPPAVYWLEYFPLSPTGNRKGTRILIK